MPDTKNHQKPLCRYGKKYVETYSSTNAAALDPEERAVFHCSWSENFGFSDHEQPLDVVERSENREGSRHEGTQVTSTVSTVSRWDRFLAVGIGVIIPHVPKKILLSPCIYQCDIPDLIFTNTCLKHLENVVIWSVPFHVSQFNRSKVCL